MEDYTKVTLVGRTIASVTDMSTEEFIAYVARVSNPANQHNSKSAPKLLKYLVENGHWSPFEMASLVMEIKTTRDIGRQILRHRSFSFQEFSQRYAEVDSMNFVHREVRLQDTKNRQASIETYDLDLTEAWYKMQDEVVLHAKSAYSWALGKGIAKEQARAVLPEGMTMSTIYMSGTVRSWIHYCQVRCDPSTQKEHRLVAAGALKVLTEEIPSIADIL